MTCRAGERTSAWKGTNADIERRMHNPEETFRIGFRIGAVWDARQEAKCSRGRGLSRVMLGSASEGPARTWGNACDALSGRRNRKGRRYAVSRASKDGRGRDITESDLLRPARGHRNGCHGGVLFTGNRKRRRGGLHIASKEKKGSTSSCHAGTTRGSVWEGMGGPMG